MTRTFKCGHDMTPENSIGSGTLTRCRTCHEVRKDMYAQRNRRIGNMARGGVPLADIAARFGLSRCMIREILINEGVATANPFLADPTYPHRALDAVASASGSRVEEIRGPGRLRHLVNARNAYAMVMWERGMSYSGIGRRINRDRATVRHGIEVGGNLMERGDREIARLYQQALQA